MKKGPALVVFLVLFPAFLGARDTDRPLVTVMDFDLSGISEAEGRLLVDFISNSVRETDRYRIIDRAQRDSILEEQEFSLSGCTDEKCQLEVGKLLAANLMFVGSIGKIGDRYILNMKLVDVATGETVGTASEKYTDLNMLVDDSSRLVLGMLGSGREPSAVEEKEAPLQDVQAADIPDAEFILYNPGSLFRPDSYTFNGQEYRFRMLQGFSSMVEAILWSVPDMDDEYEQMLEGYLEDIKRHRLLCVSGIVGEVLGGVAIIIGAGSDADVVAGVGLIGFVGGAVLNLIHGLKIAGLPEELVNYYNLRYAGR